MVGVLSVCCWQGVSCRQKGSQKDTQTKNCMLTTPSTSDWMTKEQNFFSYQEKCLCAITFYVFKHV